VESRTSDHTGQTAPHSGLAIATALTVRVVFRLALRRTKELKRYRTCAASRSNDAFCNFIGRKWVVCFAVSYIGRRISAEEHRRC
jgi:hypothetical protein